MLIAWSCSSSVISFPSGMSCVSLGSWGLVRRVSGMEATALYRYLVSVSCVGVFMVNWSGKSA